MLNYQPLFSIDPKAAQRKSGKSQHLGQSNTVNHLYGAAHEMLGFHTKTAPAR